MSEEDNIQEESIDNSPQVTNENNAAELQTCLPDRQATNQKLQTEMEVHKHPHHVTHKKKWAGYFPP